MPAHSKLTNEETCELLRTLAAQNGGWLSTRDYDNLAPPVSPCYRIVCLRMGVTSWEEVCKIAKIAPNHDATLPEVLSEDDIRAVIKLNKKGAIIYSIPHRQQVAVWCLRQAAQVIGNSMLRSEYDRVAKTHGLVGSWIVAAAFAESWNRALTAAGLEVPHKTKIGEERKEYRNAHSSDAKQESIMAETRANKWPANWRTIEVGIKTLEPVTEVTVYRTLTPGVGIRVTETRACIR